MSEEKSKKPANTAFKQQRLKAWQPLLTPKTVLPTLFVAGIFFSPLGGIFLSQSDSVNEIIIDYTECKNNNGSLQVLDDSLYSYKFTKEGDAAPRIPSYRFTKNPIDGEPGNCTIRFNTPIDINAPVFLYYRLTNFYQNHRKYVKSLSYNQLHGDVITPQEAASSCTPVSTNKDGKIYYPCGLIANSMFNDTFHVSFVNPPGGQSNTTLNFDETGIAWPADKDRLATTQMNPNDIVPPPNWAKKYPDGYTENDIFKPQLDEHFQVWMRTSWYPTFRKLYAAQRDFKLDTGIYEVTVVLSSIDYDITAYGGTKSIVISGTSFLGDRNPFMGLAWIVMGCVCTLLGVVFLGWHFFKPRKLGDHDRLSWQQSSGPGQ